MVLELTESKLRLDGAQRSCTPEETLDRMRPHFHSAGITRLGEITGLDRIGIPVAQCVRPAALVLAVDSGKGATPAAAQCSAMMEGFERHVGETSNPQILTESVVNLGDSCETRLPLLKGAALNPRGWLEWTEARTLLSRNPIFVPHCAVKLLARQPANCSWTHSPFAFTSNGLSSGNTFSEAIAGGLYEVIERDATYLAQERIAQIPRVDLDSITDPTVARLVKTIRAADITPVLLDCTCDTKVPTYICYLIDVDKGQGMHRGYAAHLDPAVAMARALTETVQARAVWIAGSRDDLTHERYTDVKSLDTAAALADFYRHQTISANAHADRSGHTFEADIETLCNLLDQAGIPEPIFYEFQHPYPCSVVRVIVPTLEGYRYPFSQPGLRARAVRTNPV